LFQSRRAQTIAALILLAFAVLTGLTWVNYLFAVQNPGGNDFLARWVGARSWVEEGISPYDEQVSLEAQRRIYGRPARPEEGEDVAHFVYPLTSMIFFAPFGTLDYPLARALWMTVLETSLALLAIVSMRFAGWKVSPVKAAVLILFSLLWYHGARSILVGQFAAFNALLIALALLMIKRKQDILAGVLLALSTAKPQMIFLIIPFVVLWAFSTGRRDLAWATLGSIAILLAASLLFIPTWPLQMIGQMLDYPTYTSIGSPLSVIAGTMPGISRPLNLFFHTVALVYLLVEWRLALGKDERHFFWTALLTLVITNLVAFRTATTNYVMLVPVLFTIFYVWEERWAAGGSWTVGLSLALFGIGLWALFLATVEGNVEHAIMYLPLPFFCLFGLWWIRWWSTHPPRVLVDRLTSRY
jgi:hypothetical protein